MNTEDALAALMPANYCTDEDYGLNAQSTTGGWVLMDETPRDGHSAPRFYLVAAGSPDEAIALARDKFGRTFAIRGPAQDTHLKRRNMKHGDVYAI